ncbi:uncharacterized protein LOC111119591 isoform X2 [Crassostrea virginica]
MAVIRRNCYMTKIASLTILLMLIVSAKGQGVKPGNCRPGQVSDSCMDDCEFDTDCEGRMKCCQVECTQGQRGAEGAWRCVTPMFRLHVDPFGPFAK